MKELKIQLAKDRLAQLESERCRVQGRLESNSGLLDCLRMSSEERKHLLELDQLLFEEIIEQTGVLIRLNEPEDRLKPLLSNIYGCFAITSTAAGFWWATFRGWALLRMEYAPYTAEQLHWRKGFLQLNYRYPPRVDKFMFYSAMFLAFYYSVNPPPHLIVLARN
jgi:hypothetical protein